MRIRAVSCVVLLAVSVSGIVGAEPSEKPLEEARLFGRSELLHLEVEMMIESSRGSKSRGLEIYIDRSDGSFRLLAQVVSPSFMDYMKLLQIRDGNRPTQQWLKTSRGVRRLAESDGGMAVFDSDFTSEDLSDVDLADYRVAALEDGILSDADCYRYSLRPLQGRNGYETKIVYVGMEDSLIRGVDYLVGDTIVRQYRLLETKRVSGQLFPQRAVMENLEAHTRTVIEIDRIDQPNRIPQRMFAWNTL